jgi:flap endonuclease-1
MGIKNFINFLKRFAPNCITNKKINEYTNKKIGIDANLLLYKLIYAIRANGYDLKNKEIIVTHIHALLLKLLAFKRLQIIPVFVFDGLSHELKTKTLDNRSDIKNKLIEKYKHSQTKKGKRIYYYIKSSITHQEVKECQELIELFGYQVIKAKEEADGQLAYMAKQKLIDYIASDDTDILLFGGPILLKNFTVNKLKYIQEIRLTDMLKELKISHKQLIDIGILLGSDYCHNTTFPIVATYNLIQEYGALSKIPKNIFDSDCDKAVTYFKYPPVHEITKISSQKQINKDGIIIFLTLLQFEQKYIDKILAQIKL